MSDYYFHESMVAKMISSDDYQQGYSIGFVSGYNQGKADERAKTIDEFAEMMRNLNTLNCFVDYVADEIDLEELMKYASEEIAEQMKGDKE